MYIKLMSAEDAADDDSRKCFRILEGAIAIDFDRCELCGKASARIAFEDGDVEIFKLAGNSYVMNDDGETIASFGVAPPA